MFNHLAAALIQSSFETNEGIEATLSFLTIFL